MATVKMAIVKNGNIKNSISKTLQHKKWQNDKNGNTRIGIRTNLCIITKRFSFINKSRNKRIKMFYDFIRKNVKVKIAFVNIILNNFVTL